MGWTLESMHYTWHSKNDETKGKSCQNIQATMQSQSNNPMWCTFWGCNMYQWWLKMTTVSKISAHHWQNNWICFIYRLRLNNNEVISDTIFLDEKSVKWLKIQFFTRFFYWSCWRLSVKKETDLLSENVIPLQTLLLLVQYYRNKQKTKCRHWIHENVCVMFSRLLCFAGFSDCLCDSKGSKLAPTRWALQCTS